MLVDAQNGFKEKRACVHHINVLSSVVRARLEEGKETFVCFVDFNKQTESINRGLLEYMFISCGCVGKFYNAIKSLHKAPIACVQLNSYRDGFELLLD